MSDRREDHGLAAYLNRLHREGARLALERCCGSGRWVDGMLERRPFHDDEEVYATADELWFALAAEDWREAFSHHPRLGERSLEAAPAATREWSLGEQSGAATAPREVLEALAAGNAEYERRFGHVFLLCATGRSGAAMLAELERRLREDPGDELRTAAGEQAKITRLRLAKLAAENQGRDP